MLSAFADRPELAGLTPFAALFYGTPSTYVFYDEEVATCTESLKAGVAVPELIAIMQLRLRTARKQVRVLLYTADGFVKYARADVQQPGPRKTLLDGGSTI